MNYNIIVLNEVYANTRYHLDMHEVSKILLVVSLHNFLYG